MARIKTSAFINDIAGKVGGSVFQRCQSGLILKNSPNLSFASSQSQSNVNQYLYRCQYEWQHLTECQRQIWNSFAKFTKKGQKHSKSIHINGHQLFIQCNFYRYQYGFSTLTEPQFMKGNLSEFTSAFYLQFNNLIMQLSRDAASAYEFVILQATTKVSPSLNNPGSRYKSLIFTTTNTSMYNITSAYREVFGFTPAATNVLFFKYSLANKVNGLIKPFQTKRVVLT
jgi:hypothetical protein